MISNGFCKTGSIVSNIEIGRGNDAAYGLGSICKCGILRVWYTTVLST